ncbi:MAG: hypothetical protein ACRDD1_06725, partial [Planctomycetia bacterium]
WRKDGDAVTLSATYQRPADGAATIAAGLASDVNYEVRATALTNPRRTSTPTAWRAFRTSVLAAGGGTADNVLWSGVTGTGRPSNNADVTAVNISAGFTGQGWGATASETQASNARVPLGANMLVDTDFHRGAALWAGAGANTTGVSIIAGVNNPGYHGGMHVLYALAFGTPAGGTYFDAASSAQATATKMERVAPNDRLHFGALCAYLSATYCWVALDFYNSAGSYLSSASAYGGRSGGGAGGLAANFDFVGDFATAPANAAFAALSLRVVCSGAANPYGFFAQPRLVRVPSTQITAPLYSPGSPERLADRTGANIAAGFTGQAWGATAAQSQVDNSLITLAGLGGAAQLSASGSTRAAAVTAASGSATTGAVTITASGGTAPYT